MKRSEMAKLLKERGIKFKRNAKNEELADLLGLNEPKEEPDLDEAKPVEPEAAQQKQLVEILTLLSNDIKNLKDEMAELKKPAEVFSIGVRPVQSAPVEIKQENDTMFLTQVPVDLLKVAREVLGDKFQFECEAMKDRPSFAFTVVVPSEYSLVAEGVDKRTKIIENSLGMNGVRDWCALVKQNVIKFLGKTITV